MSLCVYNNVPLNYLKTNSISEEPQLSADGVDYLYTKVILDANYTWNPSNLSGLSPAQAHTALRSALLLPRHPLVFNNGVDVFNVAINQNQANPNCSGATAVDVGGGPIPRHLDIVRIAGQTSWLVRFVIEFNYNDCTYDQYSSPILSNRWSRSEDVDTKQNSVIITEGRAVLRLDALMLPDANGNQRWADSFRSKILPQVPPFFRREVLHFHCGSDNKTVTYRCIDRLCYVSLGSFDPNAGPTPANTWGVVDFQAYHSTSSANTEGSGFPSLYVLQNVSGVVEGNFFSTRSSLTAFVLKLVAERLQLLNPDNSKRGRITQASITQALHDSEVKFSFTALFAPGPAGGNNAVGLGPINVQTLFSGDTIALLPDSGLNPQFYDSGAISRIQNPWAMLLTQFIMCDCTMAPQLQVPASAFPRGTSSDYITTPPPRPYQQPLNNPVPPDSTQTKYSNSTTTSAITNYHIDIRYDTDYHTVQCPVTENPSFSSSYPDATNRPKTEYVVVGAPSTDVVIEWTAERIDKQPPAPKPYLDDDNYIIVRTTVVPAAPELLADGQSMVYRISGRYVYGLKQYKGAGDTLNTGVLPVINMQWSDTQTPAISFVPGVLDDGNNTDDGDPEEEDDGGDDGGDGGGGDGGGDGGQDS